MQVTFEIDPDDRQILAVYFTLSEGRVHRTVEVSAGECYVDEDRSGNVLGVEMLSPGQLQILARKVSRKYHLPEMRKAVNQLRSACCA